MKSLQLRSRFSDIQGHGFGGDNLTLGTEFGKPVQEFTRSRKSIWSAVDSMSVKQAVLPLSIIKLTIWPSELTLAMLLAILKFSRIVFVTLRISVPKLCLFFGFIFFLGPPLTNRRIFRTTQAVATVSQSSPAIGWPPIVS
jgi:hypothetical protein